MSVSSFTKFLYFTDFLSELIKSRKKRTAAFKAGKYKAKINDFELSDDEGKHERTKKVSFMKTKKISLPLEDTTASESCEKEPPDSSISGQNNYSNSFSSQHSINVSANDTQLQNSVVESVDPQITRESSSKSLSYQTSDDTLLDVPLPLPSDSSNPVLEESRQTPHLSGSDLKDVPSAGLCKLFYKLCL